MWKENYDVKRCQKHARAAGGTIMLTVYVNIDQSNDNDGMEHILNVKGFPENCNGTSILAITVAFRIN